MALIGMGLVTNTSLIGAFSIGYGFALSLRTVSLVTLRQTLSPPHLLGRVTSTWFVLTALPLPLGATLGTGLASHFGAPMGLQMMGLALLVLLTLGTMSAVNTRIASEASAPPTS